MSGAGLPQATSQWGPFTGGIDNLNKRETLPPNFLREAENIDIDNRGWGSIREGMGAAIVSGLTKNGFNSKDQNTALFVIGNTLFIINADLTITALRSDLIAGLPMSYCEVNDQIWYSNNQVIAYIHNGQSFELTAPTGVYQIGSQQGVPIFAFKSLMRPGEIIRYYDWSIYTIAGGLIRWSDSGHFASTDLRRNFKRVPGRITLFEPVKGGIFISFDGWTYFSEGTQLTKANLKPLEKAQAIPGSSENVARYKTDAGAGNEVRWTSTSGICRGLDYGAFKNLTSKTYIMPPNVSSAAGFYREHKRGFGQYISALQIGG